MSAAPRKAGKKAAPKGAARPLRFWKLEPQLPKTIWETKYYVKSALDGREWKIRALTGWRSGYIIVKGFRLLSPDDILNSLLDDEPVEWLAGPQGPSTPDPELDASEPLWLEWVTHEFSDGWSSDMIGADALPADERERIEEADDLEEAGWVGFQPTETRFSGPIMVTEVTVDGVPVLGGASFVVSEGDDE